MSEVTITVRGESETRIAPQRATIHVSVRTDGADRAATVEHALALAEPVRRSLTDRADAGTLDTWSSSRLSLRAERPWNSDGVRLEPVHYAGVDFTATFTEASELSLWVSDVSAWEGVEIGGVDWRLTPDTLARTEREVAAAAVAVAVARAEAYAGALGRGTVVPVEIADVGLISPDRPAPQFMKARALSAAADSGGASMEYEPEDIVVSATVEARFTAR